MTLLKPIVVGGREFDFRRSVVMGILNVTPDSFSDGGRYAARDAAFRRIEQMISDGADMIDVGAESTRPGSESVSKEEELERLLPVLSEYRRYFDVPLSLDTSKSGVASVGFSYGVDVINDVSGMSDPDMIDVVSRANATLIVMHCQGTPQDMQDNPVYADVVVSVKERLQKLRDLAVSGGVRNVIVDPGFGFGKTVTHNVALLRELGSLRSLGCPILVGTSRKSFIGAIIGESDPNKREIGSISSMCIAAMKGAHFFRVHDVRSARQALDVVDCVRAENDNGDRVADQFVLEGCYE